MMFVRDSPLDDALIFGASNAAWGLGYGHMSPLRQVTPATNGDVSWFRFIIFYLHTPSFWLTYTFQIIIRTWRWGVTDQKMVCSGQEQDRILCQVPFRFLKSLVWAGKEFKVKKDFQPCFAEQKAHGGTRNRSSSRGNLYAHPWKFIEIKDFSWMGV